MSEIKAIETYYKGYRFRSRLEARWAVFFDAAGIKWEYEPEGFVMSDGTNYLPDFYLPESKTFFECKGIMSEYDQHKSRYVRERKRICCCYWLSRYDILRLRPLGRWLFYPNKKILFCPNEVYRMRKCAVYWNIRFVAL